MQFYKAEERDYRAEILALLRSDKREDDIRVLLQEYHDRDIASVLEELTAEDRDRVWHILGNEGMSDVVPFLEDAGEYLSNLAADEAADILEQMDADEALEALDDLDDDVRQEVLEHIEEDIKEDIELLDSYDDDEFGSRMSTNYITIGRGANIKTAMKTLVAEAAENDNIYTLFVTNDDGSFYGAIDLKELIVARSDIPLEELIYTNFPYVYDKDSIAENVERLRGYSEDLIPVLSSANGGIVGVITAIDIAELVDEELGDDYAKLAALSSEEEKDETLFTSMKKRIPWLVILLFLGLGVSAIVGLFEGVVAELPMIVAFQSLILGMAGNVGTQSLAVTVRALGDNANRGFKERGLLIAKETRVALLNGLALGLFSFAVVGAYFWLSGHAPTVAFTTAGCVGAALCFAMTISGFTGATIPLCFYRLGIDPAVASGPLITTINDLVAVISYYGLAWGLLLNFGR